MLTINLTSSTSTQKVNMHSIIKTFTTNLPCLMLNFKLRKYISTNWNHQLKSRTDVEDNVACMEANGLMGYGQNGRHWVCSQNMVGGRRFWGNSFIRKLRPQEETKMLAIKENRNFSIFFESPNLMVPHHLVQLPTSI